MTEHRVELYHLGCVYEKSANNIYINPKVLLRVYGYVSKQKQNRLDVWAVDIFGNEKTSKNHIAKVGHRKGFSVQMNSFLGKLIRFQGHGDTAKPLSPKQRSRTTNIEFEFSPWRNKYTNKFLRYDY